MCAAFNRVQGLRDLGIGKRVQFELQRTARERLGGAVGQIKTRRTRGDDLYFGERVNQQFQNQPDLGNGLCFVQHDDFFIADKTP